MKTETHRQHGRIVQSHHRILCNNSTCRCSSLLSLSLSPSPPLPLLCHLTSSVSLVCLTDSKSPSLCPRSLCLPCQSLPSSPLPHLLLVLLLLCWLCPCHSPLLACLLVSFFFSSPPYLPPCSFLSVTHSLFFSSPLPLAPSFSSTPSSLFLLLCPFLAHLLCLFFHPPPLSPR